MKERTLPDTLAMASFFLSGSMAMGFGLFSILGTLMGAGMTALSVMGEDVGGIAMGALLLIAYGLWMVVCLGVGALHLWAGYRLATGKKKGGWLWVAAGLGLALAVTVYCAPFGFISAGLGAYAALQDQDPDAA